jgi:hypothetical protein
MHSNISITDGVYGILSDNDIRGQIEKLSEKPLSSGTLENKQLILLLRSALNQLEKDNS